MEHPENNPEYAGLTVNSGVGPVTAVNPHLNRKRFSRHRLSAADYVEGILKGNITVLGQAVTLVESTIPEHQAIAQEVIEKCLPYTGNSRRIGITGVPGAGKSTFLINGMCVYAFSNNNYGQIFKGMVDGRYVDAETAEKLGIPANENPNADYPRLTYGNNSNNNRASSYWMRDGRYLRLKNVDIGYTLPKQWVNRAHLNDVRLFLQATNLLTFSKFDTWDPEMGSSNGQSYPITKAVTLGVQVNL